MELFNHIIIIVTYCPVGNAKPRGIFETRVYGFDDLQTRVPGFDACHLGRRLYGRDLRAIIVWTDCGG